MWLELVGWAGSLLIVVSLVLANVWGFRVLNLVGALLATAYNAALGIWPFVAMNGAIVLINLWWLARLRGTHAAAGGAADGPHSGDPVSPTVTVCLTPAGTGTGRGA